MISAFNETVRRRIINQMLSSMLYENIVRFTKETKDGVTTAIIEGQPATYRVDMTEADSFQRVTLRSPIYRVVGDEAVETINYAQFLREAQFTFEKDMRKVESFITELVQTELKDSQAQQYRAVQNPRVHLSFDDLESYAMEGHMYHPSYKSRLGFTLEDNLKYGPDFKPTFQLTWVAIPKHLIERTVSQNINVTEMLRHQLGASTYDQFIERLQRHQLRAEDVEIIPVHPWQFKHIVTGELAEEWLNGNIIVLGESEETYTPQQSIRTLYPVQKDKYYIKVPLSITNTSTKRVLAPHTIENAAQITDWLKRIQCDDTYLSEQLRTVFLGEVLGMSYVNKGLSTEQQTRIYGALGVIWRENLHHYLTDDEDAIPFNALYTKDQQGTPVIDTWIKQYGAEAWMKQFITVAVRPIIHMLYFHGVALESHGQNMMLIHENGWPTRVAIKDFHDGIRFKPSLLSDIAKDPQLKDTPEEHKKVNRNSFIETEVETLVRDFVHDAFFFINIAQIIMFIEEAYGISERTQWRYVYDEICAYQSLYPALDNYTHFDLFEPTIQVEKLTTRRLQEDNDLKIHDVSNPLGVIHNENINVKG